MMNLKNIFALIAMFAITMLCGATEAQETAESKTAKRAFELTYAASIEGVPKDAKVRVWFPVAKSNKWQEVKIIAADFQGKHTAAEDASFGNKIGYFEVENPTKPVSFELTYDIVRKETKTEVAKMKLTDQQKTVFLRNNKFVPTSGKPTGLLKDQKLPEDRLAAGRKLYDLVNDHMKYDKSIAGYGKGDVLRACDVGAGNCTDFHSLFISLARNQKIPSRFEIGFPLPAATAGKKETGGEIKGYHCWAWFHSPDNGWVPVDISEADKDPSKRDYFFGNLTADRVAFSTGRDIKLVPESKAGPLNYFIYPHVEVDGKVWPKEKVVTKFSYKNR